MLVLVGRLYSRRTDATPARQYVLASACALAACGSGIGLQPYARQHAPVITAARLVAGDARAAATVSNIERTRADFTRRQHVLIQHFLTDLARNGIGDFARAPACSSFRRIAAGLFALGLERTHARDLPDGPRLFEPSVVSDFPARVEAFTRSLYHFRPGTVGGLPRQPGDYDFLMKDMVSLLYLFRDRPDLLTDEAAFQIVDGSLAALASREARERLTFRVNLPLLGALLEYPETENHVLMTLSSIYLTNQWIFENPRDDPRLRSGRYRDPARFDNRGSPLEDMLLQATGRVLHDGFWETNGRPYQAMSAQALLNLSTFATSDVMRTAARNALDYLATKFAFQSFEMKRIAPYRRSGHNAATPGIFDNDGVIFMFAALAGGYPWPDAFFGSDNAAGHALWASLLNYRVPATVQEFMLDKHDGYWARMQARYGDADYVKGRPGRYFDHHAQALVRGKPQFLQELYFVTPHFMNAAGGRYRRYHIFGDLFAGNDGVHDLDFLSRPQTIIPSGPLAQWSSLSQMEDEVLCMPGEARFWHSDNSGTYKSFSYGYYHDGDDRDRHLDFPMRVPAALRPYLLRHADAEQWQTDPDSRARFMFLDLSSLPRYGFYVVLGQVSKAENSVRHRAYARGFWEIVPRERFASVQALKDYVLVHNPSRAFPAVSEGPGRFYRYTMTTGETLELDDRLGAPQRRCQNPIRRVWGPDADPDHDNPLPLSATVFDRCDPDAVARMPLLEVQAVDRDFRLTGRRLAYAIGDGQLWVENPYLGGVLHLDSSDYRDPKRTERLYGVARRLEAPGELLGHDAQPTRAGPPTRFTAQATPSVPGG